MNVDRAQGLSTSDIFRSQPPVKSTGSLAGRRPTREFDSLLHTAPIARGNSGGPLLDDCGRVIGVNSFGAESTGAEAEFYFAVSARELLTFLRANSVAPQVNGMPCRSLADLEAEERARAERDMISAQARAQVSEEALDRRRDEERREVEFALISERENGMALTLVLLIVALGAGGRGVHAVRARRAPADEDRCRRGLLALGGAVAAWVLRPGYDEVEGRLEDLLHAEMEPRTAARSRPRPRRARLRARSAAQPRDRRAPQDLPLDWSPSGCVNGARSTVSSNGTWSRVFVPDAGGGRLGQQLRPGGARVPGRALPARPRGDGTRAHAARRVHRPACGAGREAALELGAQQEAVVSLLPSGRTSGWSTNVAQGRELTFPARLLRRPLLFIWDF
jgi:hypothetical protein